MNSTAQAGPVVVKRSLGGADTLAGNTYSQENLCGFTQTRGRSHVHDFHNLPVPTTVANRASNTWEHEATVFRGPCAENPIFRNSASSPYWPLPPQPFSNAVAEDLAALRRQPTVPVPVPLEGEPVVPPEFLVRHDRLYLGEAEETLRRQTANRLMEHLPEMRQMTDERADRDSRTVLDELPWHQRYPAPDQGRLTPSFVPPANSSSVGFQYSGFSRVVPEESGFHRTPVDTSARLLQAYMFSSEPAFGTATPGYQASRVGTLMSEAPLAREMGPVGPVQGLMLGRYNVATRFEQETKNFSIGRNTLGPVLHSRSPLRYPGA